MAQLTDDSQQGAAINSTEILSPQPFVPSGEGFLVSSLESSNETSRPENAQMRSDQDYEYNSSSTRHSTSDVFGHEMDDELERLKSRASSRSSLSSGPSSVLIHPVHSMKQMPDMDIHEKMAGYRLEASEASFGDFNDIPPNIRTIRQREAAFRKPSSVRAMQMHTEDEADEDDYLTPPRRRQSHRSPGSSPLKRSPYYLPNASKQLKPKREAAPLVLLHCTLLPPSLPVPGASDPRNQDILEDELPPEYWRRWRRLQDRVGSGVLRDRGVLISHPEDLYDMLEERLLESLELQRPRLQNGHFVGHDDHSSGSGSEGDFSDIGESETDGEQGDECPDCGNHVRHGDSNRKWEIRVFAANGLMRAGAWAAAWPDMEKVDVEVGLWLPSDVRRGLERRLAESQMAVAERTQGQAQTSQSHMDMHMSSLVNRDSQVPPEILQSPRQSHARMITDVESFRSDGISFRQSFSEAGGQSRIDHAPELGRKTKEHEVALSTLLVNYIRVLAADRRNIALVLLSVLVAFLASGSRQQQVFLYSDTGPLTQGMSQESLATSAIPSLNMASSLPTSASLVSSVDARNTAILNSVDSLSIHDSSSTVAREEVALSTETAGPGSPTYSSSAQHTMSTECVEPTDTLVSSHVLEATQSQTEETTSVSSLSTSTVGSLSVPEENSESTETMQLPPEANAETFLSNSIDSSTESIEPTSSYTEDIESPTLSNVHIETESPRPERGIEVDSVESLAVSSELLTSSASATVGLEDLMKSVETSQFQPESKAETSLSDAVDSFAPPAEVVPSASDYMSPTIISDMSVETNWPQPDTHKEAYEEERNDQGTF